MLGININKLHAENDKLHTCTNIIVLHVDMNSPVHIFYLACRWRKHVPICIPIGVKGGGRGGVVENTERHLLITTCIRLLDTNELLQNTTEHCSNRAYRDKNHWLQQ